MRTSSRSLASFARIEGGANGADGLAYFLLDLSALAVQGCACRGRGLDAALKHLDVNFEGRNKLPELGALGSDYIPYRLDVAWLVFLH